MHTPPWDPLASLSVHQRDQLAAFEEQMLRLNRRINLISRDTEAVFKERHVVHSLALTVRTFPAGSTVVDWGAGGGLPAIPLAICFPDVAIHAVDAVGKKMQAVQTMGRRLGLANLHPWHGRAEAWPEEAHFSVSRATAPLTDLWTWHRRVVRPLDDASESPEWWRPGLICLKGGDLADEVQTLHAAYPGLQVDLMPLEPLLGRPYFAEKYIVEVFDSV